jgi:hypothetical protein
MPISSSDIKYKLTGGVANTDPNLSLGGIPSTTDVVDNTSENVFDNVTGQESTDGLIDYRGIALKNNHGSLTYLGVHIWIQQQPTATGDVTAIGLDSNGLNQNLVTIATELLAPAGVVFTAPANYAAGLVMGDIPFSQFFGFWLRRTISAVTSAYTDDTFQIEVQGETAS